MDVNDHQILITICHFNDYKKSHNNFIFIDIETQL